MNSTVEVQDDEIVIREEQAYRAGAYSLFAMLLHASPDQKMLDHLKTFAELGKGQSEIEIAMYELGCAAEQCEPEKVSDEFHTLFIGLGRGELLPYGSYYQTGFLMEKPLGELRADLANLGYERSEKNKEPEDHIASLCEVMAALIRDGLENATTANCIEQQRRFYDAHITSWIQRFFADLAASSSADFYWKVATFGKAFFEFETAYFSMKV